VPAAFIHIRKFMPHSFREWWRGWDTGTLVIVYALG
jgi:hypothetical protein